MYALRPGTMWLSVRVTISKLYVILLLVPTKRSWCLEAQRRNENRNSGSVRRKTSSVELGLASCFLLSYIAYLAEAHTVRWKTLKNKSVETEQWKQISYKWNLPFCDEMLPTGSFVHQLEESIRNLWRGPRGGYPPPRPVLASVPKFILLGRARSGDSFCNALYFLDIPPV